jgi:hypothetical protein
MCTLNGLYDIQVHVYCMHIKSLCYHAKISPFVRYVYFNLTSEMLIENPHKQSLWEALHNELGPPFTGMYLI